MPTHPATPAHLRALHTAILGWYSTHQRDLPWRRPECSPWGVFVSEIMLQQTPVARVEPVWQEWMRRWPTPSALAAESSGEAVRAWGRLGYPRRALRLHAAASAMVSEHHGEVPCSIDELRALPGVGEYTASAVAAFAFGVATTVVDTNVRRVLARLFDAEQYPAPSLTRAEMRRAAAVVPADVADGVTWNVAVMELGAVVCTARSPQCGACPVTSHCAWLLAGKPAHTGAPRRGQAWEGTDRQVRGRILATLRTCAQPVGKESFADAGPDQQQVDRCLASLIEDGLLEADQGRYALPA